MWFVLGGRVYIFKEGACGLYWVGMFTSLRKGHVVCIGWVCKEGACGLYWVGVFASLRKGHVVCIGWARKEGACGLYHFTFPISANIGSARPFLIYEARVMDDCTNLLFRI